VVDSRLPRRSLVDNHGFPACYLCGDHRCNEESPEAEGIRYVTAHLIGLMSFELIPCALESDSDSEVDYHGNRGRKLKKGARFAHEGQLAPPSGPELYREVGTFPSICPPLY
jgi:hypothetical protein